MQGNTLYSLPAALMLIVRAITTGKSKNESRPKKSCAHQNLSPIHSLFRKTSSTQFKCCGSAAPFACEKEAAMRDGDNEERAPARCCWTALSSLRWLLYERALPSPPSASTAAHVIRTPYVQIAPPCGSQ